MSLIRRHPLIAAAIVATIAAVVAVVVVLARRHHHSAALPTPVVDVTKVGAVADGHTDSTAAIIAAIARAQANGRGTVYFPPGSYAVDATVTVPPGPAITVAGAGASRTTIVETRSHRDLLNIKADGSTVEDLTLDTRTFGAGHGLGVVANDTTLQRAHILSGSFTFALYYAGPKGATPDAPLYNSGNQVLDTTVDDLISDDGFSFSFQQDATIRGIVHHGSRLALYVDTSVTIDGYRYSPGPQTTATDGFFITAPSHDITITGFVSSGHGGVIGQTPRSHPQRRTSAVTITGEELSTPGAGILIGDVDGLTIRGGRFDGSDIRFNPTFAATGVVIRDSTLGAVTFAQAPGASVDQAEFTNDVYDTVTPQPGRPGTATFAVLHGGATTFAATGGAFRNPGGFISGKAHYQVDVPGAPRPTS